MSSKSVSRIFKILFKTGYINIFVLHVVFVSRSVQLKSSSSDKKTSAVKSGTHFSREAIKVLKENSITGRTSSSAKFFIMQSYTGNANWDVPLIVENV